MKKLIQKHIEKKDYIKLFIVDEEGNKLSQFNGIIHQQNEKFVLMSEMHDFYFEGFTIIRKKDISEIKHTDNEKYFKHILEEEKILDQIVDSFEKLKFPLSNFREMFIYILDKKIPTIIECQYGNDDRFIIGPVESIDKKRVKVKHFNALGNYELKTVPAKFKDITFFSIDEPYANILFKYAHEIE